MTGGRRDGRGMRPGGGSALRSLAVGLAALAVMACGGPDGDDAPAGTGAGGPATAEEVEPWTPELAAELRAMREEDQAVRRGFGPEVAADTAFMGRMLRADSAHSLRLRELVERHGWPRAPDVGEEAARGAFLVVQHTPFHGWQREMLPLVEQAVRSGELEGQDYALLYDRVRVRLGEPQRYGTQLRGGPDGLLHLEPLEDTASVDSLRAELGLPPLDVYLDLVEESMGMTVDRELAGS